MASKETEMFEVLDDVKPIDLTPLISKDNNDIKSINKVSQEITDSLLKYGVAIVKDPRVTYEKNESFLDMMEDYFNQPTNIKNKDSRPELAFQIGATPSRTETARNHCKRINNLYNKNTNINNNNKDNINKKAIIHTLDKKHHPWTPCPPEADPKWRYFWRLGSQGIEIDEKTENNIENIQKDKTGYVMLNASNITPNGFNKWNQTCDEWGTGLLNAAKTISEGIAIGLGLKDRYYFVKKMIDSANLLAPTATDLNKFDEYGTIIAGYHYDLNFVTVHGKSRYPGLSVFLRDGTKVRVKVPDGCLLCQAAKQLEWLTGGVMYAGFHEVCVNEATIKKINSVKTTNDAIDNGQIQGRKHPLWRISSTMFAHINSKVELEPIKDEDVLNKKFNFRSDNALKLYPKQLACEQVMEEIRAIGLVVDIDKKNKINQTPLVSKIDNLINLVENIESTD